MSFCSDSMSDMENNIPAPTVKQRYYILDAYRGLCIVLMLFHHIGFNLEMYGYLPSWLLYNPFMSIVQPFFAGSFIFMSGCSCRFSRSNLKRGLILVLLAGGVSLVTYYFTPDLFISFGILHFLAFATLSFWALHRLFEIKHKNWFVWSVVSAATFLILFFVAFRFFPTAIEKNGFAFLGLISESFSSGDYYPVLPWIFLFFAGCCLGEIIQKDKMPKWFYTFRCPFFEKIGKLSLIIYLVHQPLLYGIMMLWEKLIK